MSGHSKSATSVSDASCFSTPDPAYGSGEGHTSPIHDGSMKKMLGVTARKRISRLTRRTKARTKTFFKLHGATTSEQSGDEDGDPLDSIKTNPAFSSSRVMKKSRFHPGKTADKTLGAFQSIGNAVVHPVEAVKSTATRTTAGQLSKAERPFLSQKADIEFLQAHDNLKHAESTGSSKQGTLDEEQESLSGHRDKIREMEEQRESLRVAWTSSHVRRARVVKFPDNEYFEERDEEHGGHIRHNWLKWLGYVILPCSWCCA